MGGYTAGKRRIWVQCDFVNSIMNINARSEVDRYLYIKTPQIPLYHHIHLKISDFKRHSSAHHLPHYLAVQRYPSQPSMQESHQDQKVCVPPLVATTPEAFQCNALFRSQRASRLRRACQAFVCCSCYDTSTCGSDRCEEVHMGETYFTHTMPELIARTARLAVSWSLV